MRFNTNETVYNSSEQKYIYIVGSFLFVIGAHHVDLRFSTKEDPKWLKDVRRKEVEIIQKWISQYYHSLTDLEF